MVGKKILTIRTSSILKKNKIVRNNVAYNDAKKIGILFSAADKNKYDNIKEFKQQLEEDGKQVDVLSYLGKGKENYEFRFEIFSAKDVSFWGRFTSDAVIKFADTDFDYLFCIDKEPNIFNEHIIAMSKAKCRVGTYQEGKSEFYELMIHLNKNKAVQDLIKEMRHYIKRLRA